MNQRAQYLIQIIDKIGVPLLSAAEHGNNDTDTAQIVASLLAKVVETSISMNQVLDLNPTDSQDDSLRVVLAALAGSIISDQYQKRGKIPETGDLSRIQSAMQAILTFGDNFNLSPDNVGRLEQLKANGTPVDANQVTIQYANALIPVINAISNFPFGQPEQKLMMDVSDRLVKRTAEMREALLPDLTGDDQKLAELAVLRANADIYAACHEGETKRLVGSDADIPEDLSIAPVWEAFETRTAMLEAVVKNMIPGNVVTEAAQGAGSVAPPAKPQPETPPVQPQAPQPPAQTEAAAGEVSVESSGGASPMGFFAQPKDEDTAPPLDDNSVSPPLVQPETPPVTAPPASPPPAQEAPSIPAADEKSDEKGDDSGSGDQTGGNPMSFFGKKE